MLTKGQLAGILVSFNETRSLHLLEEPAVLEETCLPRDLSIVIQMSAIISRLLDTFDYSRSPEFLRSVEGKSPEFLAMKLRMITPIRRTEVRKRLGDALANVLKSNAAFELVDEPRHKLLEELRTLLFQVSNRSDLV